MHRLVRTIAGLGFGLGLFVLAADADAGCRSTTCRAKKDKECPLDDDGCVTDGAKLFWPTRCLGFAMNRLGTQFLDPDATLKIVEASFMAWNDVECPDGTTAAMTFHPLDHMVPCKKSEYNKNGKNINVILFQDDDWKYRGIDGTLAKTSVTYNDDTGEIYDADIEVNTANNPVTIGDDGKVRYDLQAILTHEAGHFIGIAHSLAPSAVMYASYSPGDTDQRELNPDDVKVLCEIYPSTSEAACNDVPRGGMSERCDFPDTGGICSVQPGGTASYGVATLFVASGVLAARARRRRGLAVAPNAKRGHR